MFYSWEWSNELANSLSGNQWLPKTCPLSWLWSYISYVYIMFSCIFIFEAGCIKSTIHNQQKHESNSSELLKIRAWITCDTFYEIICIPCVPSCVHPVLCCMMLHLPLHALRLANSRALCQHKCAARGGNQNPFDALVSMWTAHQCWWNASSLSLSLQHAWLMFRSADDLWSSSDSKIVVIVVAMTDHWLCWGTWF